MAYRLAALGIGLVVSGYWLRVSRMAYKARKKTGRAANFVPKESIGRALRLIWIPIVIVWIGGPFLTAAGGTRWALLKPLYASALVAWPAAAVAGACLLLSRACWKTMGKNWRMGIDPGEQNALVVAGPFGYVRHPIYALSQAMMLATVLAIPSPIMITVGLMHVLLLQWEARREEAHMRNVHGTAYVEYCAGVSRFLPRF
jgi:protein-S-isoprenylcysteine O-methyltransferase Ste14